MQNGVMRETTSPLGRLHYMTSVKVTFACGRYNCRVASPIKPNNNNNKTKLFALLEVWTLTPNLSITLKNPFFSGLNPNSSFRSNLHLTICITGDSLQAIGVLLYIYTITHDYVQFVRFTADRYYAVKAYRYLENLLQFWPRVTDVFLVLCPM